MVTSDKVHGKTIEEWLNHEPQIEAVMAGQPLLWTNRHKDQKQEAYQIPEGLSDEAIQDAEERLQRFAAFIQSAFPETSPSKGLIESPLQEISKCQKAIAEREGVSLPGKWVLKMDSHLPISGSIKARGGIYEVLQHAETLALEAGKITLDSDYAIFDSDDLRHFFSQYAIAVGSTGNLGLSIGIISAKLGFKVTVHMSSDAKTWKKNMLREKGCTVVEYELDYSVAVEEGRKLAEQDPMCYFVDDEKSLHLFLGYATAAKRVKAQLDAQGIMVDEAHPLCVYLPCGVGGGPGGVAWGLKRVFGDAVSCYFAEPTHSPCMLLGMMTGLHDAVSVSDFGLDNRTVADGLAVGRPSGLVGHLMMPLLEGIFTVRDERLLQDLKLIYDTEGIALEPSALAGFSGPVFRARSGQIALAESTTHLMWATGGSMVPEADFLEYLKVL